MPNRKRPSRPHFEFEGHEIPAGTRESVPLTIGSYLTNDELRLRIAVVHGKKPGPVLLLTGCLHGDEYNGSEIIRRILRQPRLSNMAGTLLAIPIINRPAFVTRSRYMPDRRDLNRLFPGSPSGSLGSRLAHVISEIILPKADFVIDLHTGAVNRPNLPQIRVTEGDNISLELARVFAPPITLCGKAREASFRATCHTQNKPILLYESGEALRLDTPSIRFGVQGILAVMRHLEMFPRRKREARHPQATVVSRKSYWERSPAGGIFTPLVPLGKAVEEGCLLGFVADPYGSTETPVTSTRAGLVIGRTNEAVADQGDGLFHIAILTDLDSAEDRIAKNVEDLPGGIAPDDDDDHPVPFDSIADTI